MQKNRFNEMMTLPLRPPCFSPSNEGLQDITQTIVLGCAFFYVHATLGIMPNPPHLSFGAVVGSRDNHTGIGILAATRCASASSVPRPAAQSASSLRSWHFLLIPVSHRIAFGMSMRSHNLTSAFIPRAIASALSPCMY